VLAREQQCDGAREDAVPGIVETLPIERLLQE
jgi:hypothetical protein